MAACAPDAPGADVVAGTAAPPSAITGGLGPTIVDTLERDPSDYGFGQVRAFLVVQDGRPVLEHYRESAPETTYDVGSVTTSVVSVLVGIAIDRGDLEGLQQPLGELLPEHAAVMVDGVGEVTLEELLTMTGGLPAAPVDLGRPGDVVAGVLADGLSLPAGERFVYSDRSAHLLSAVLSRATGTDVLAFAREHLLGPVGIDSEPAAEPVAPEADLPAFERAWFAWPVDPQGRHLGATGLRMTAWDMVRIGRLMADGGRREGRQIVPSWWVAESTSEHVEPHGAFRATEGYGFGWWVTTADGRPAFAAIGRGGQLIEVVPDLDLVVAVAGGGPGPGRTAGPDGAPRPRGPGGRAGPVTLSCHGPGRAPPGRPTVSWPRTTGPEHAWCPGDEGVDPWTGRSGPRRAGRGGWGTGTGDPGRLGAGPAVRRRAREGVRARARLARQPP
ncbi:serine hydrolase domain-containing protein [Georgenia sp. SUBG003]|uniref:serine hydrolase domain-containing protein n=1 Tax=Georgenia sp. SUBG003 TaxID=1497974 RepID=UPI003AB25524